MLLWEGQLQKVSFELGFELKERGEFPRLTVSEFQTVGAIKLNECSPKPFKKNSGMFSSFSLGER